MLYRTSIGELTISYLCDANYNPTFVDLFGLQRKRPQNGLTADANQWGEENALETTKMAPTNHGTSRIEVT